MAVIYLSAGNGNGGDVGVLKPVEGGRLAGSYKMPGGFFNATNEAGEHYIFNDDVKSLFTNKSPFYRMMEKQCLCGELGHPVREPGESKVEFARRFTRVSEDKQAFLIRALEVGDAMRMEGQTREVYPIWLWVEPFGVYKDVFKDSLENPNFNTSLSIRCLSKRVTQPNGLVTRTVYRIITWDAPTEPGIKHSTKRTAIEHATVEGWEDVSIPVDEFLELMHNTSDNTVESIGDMLDIRKEDFCTDCEDFKARW